MKKEIADNNEVKKRLSNITENDYVRLPKRTVSQKLQKKHWNC